MSDMIPKGCTCTNKFTFPFTKDEVESLFITYQQNKKTVIEKDLSDCIFNEGCVSVNLTQEDTLQLNDDGGIQIQIRARLTNGLVTKSKIIKTYTDTVLKDGVI